tara:strand:- start:1007 stop:1222 length:216 start_codon:yes stop_codon:yes gene_type:complete
MTIEQALEIYNTVTKIQQDWKVVTTISKNKLKSLMDNIGEAVYTFDINGMISHADELASREYLVIDAYFTK